MNNKLLSSIKNYWINNPCEEWFFADGITCNDLSKIDINQFKRNSFLRYSTEPEVIKFGKFNLLKNLHVLEIGYGLGADGVEIAKVAKSYNGIDLSEVSYKVTSRRFQLYDLKNFKLKIGSSTSLDYPNESFDFVYSWGVIHHSGDIKRSLSEIYRVLKKGGSSKIMIYNKNSLIVFIYWLYYSIRKFQFNKTREQIISENIESPGTLILSKREFSNLLKTVGFTIKNIYLFRDFFYLLRKYPKFLRPLIRFVAKFLSLILGGEKRIGYFMCVDIIK